MPFHEIREVRFTSMFNSVWDRRRPPEQVRSTGKRLMRRHADPHRPDPDREVDILA